jgi:PAS domain S-box-containing protein
VDSTSWMLAAFERLATATPAGVSVLRLLDDGDARIELANPTVGEVLQRPVEDLRGRTIREVYPLRDAEDVLERLRLARDGRDVTYEASRDLPTGRRTIVGQILPIGDGRVVVFTRDLSSEREAARRVEQMERVAGMGVYHWNARDGCISWSDELYRIFGYEPGEVTITLDRFFAHVHPDDREEQRRLTARARDEAVTVTTTFRLLRADGVERHAEVRAEAAVDDEGQLLYVVGTVQDVTERLRLEQHAEQLRRANARRRTGLEVHDKIVQGLAAAWLSLELDDQAAAMEAVQTTMANAQQVVQALLADLSATEPIRPGHLVRASGTARDPEEGS